ncbi:hypothetical protein Sta7437_0719 [Stanieria cyanosphaera PCC 7437]|uniref:Uncharacterized protein n=1 Tax=Stanieria cyanosphaera (strain ATCC 29371 / PCC 7437) TaxID=111780 RepID=K9XP56_STAC7|nr:hypothetical protein Sta7437_0719 [Stanieria cyanosphaera PCC 7437]
MLNGFKKFIYHPILCYLPTFLIIMFCVSSLSKLSPTNCLFNSIQEQCLLYNDLSLIVYHPISLSIYLLVLYTFYYLYYNIITGKNIVGKSVKISYEKIISNLKVRDESKQVWILLISYIVISIFSYCVLPYFICKKKLEI